MQAGRELAGIPRGTGDQLDERLAVDLLVRQPQRIGKARTDRADPARGIDLPQPVGLAFLELTQQQRDDFALFRHGGFGDPGGQKRARVLDRTQRDHPDKYQREQRHFITAGPREPGKGAAADDPGEQQVAQRHGRQQYGRCRHQHGGDRPQFQPRAFSAERREAGQRHDPHQRIVDRPARLAVHLVARHPAPVGIGQGLVDPGRMPQAAAQRGEPHGQQGRMQRAEIDPHHPQGGDQVGGDPQARNACEA